MDKKLLSLAIALMLSASMTAQKLWDNGTQYERLSATRGNDYLLVYNYTSREMKVDLRKITGERKNVWWMSADTGLLTWLGEYDNKVLVFSPHKTHGGIEDGVLIAIDSSKNYIGKDQRQINDI